MFHIDIYSPFVSILFVALNCEVFDPDPELSAVTPGFPAGGRDIMA